MKKEYKDLGLGKTLVTEPNDKVFEVINCMRDHLGIDHLSSENRRMLRSRNQILFLPKEEIEKFQREN